MIGNIKIIYWDIRKGGYFSSLVYTLLEMLPGQSGNMIRGSHISSKLKSCGPGLSVNKGVIISHRDFLSIGSDVIINAYSYIEAGGGIGIGNDVLIGPGVRILSINHVCNDSNRLIRKQGWSKDPVKIGNDVWLGAGTMILPGSIIPDGAVIAASSTVTKSSDIQPYTICSGSPARILRER